MDYIFVSAMREYLIVNKLVSYDIACQWSKSLLERIALFPEGVQIYIPEGSIAFVIPKLHFQSHVQEGHSPFSLNYRKGSGRTDGEGPERRWWDIQPAAASTKVMGPGQRQGVLEDHWSYANWRKSVDMRKCVLDVPSFLAAAYFMAPSLAWTLRNRLKDALKEYTLHSALFDVLTASMKPKNIAKWTAEIEAWEADPWAHDDPYVVVSAGK